MNQEVSFRLHIFISFQEAYLGLVFISSVLECKLCGKRIIHTKESIDSHFKVNLSLKFKTIKMIKKMIIFRNLSVKEGR